MFRKNNITTIPLKKNKINIIIALGVGSFNPDESLQRFDLNNAISIKPWIKYDNHWYFIKNYVNFDSIEDIADYLKNSYSEEIFLEKLMMLI